MRPRTIPQNELQQMAEHVLYEVKMFRKSFRDWQPPENDETWNPAVESALLHFRVLREFFCCLEPKRDNDIVATDYFAKDSWHPECGTVHTIFKKTKDDIDGRLAHLTRVRLTPMKWKKDEMERAMEELITRFKDSLPKPASEWFSELLKAKPSITIGDTSPGTASVKTF